MASGHLVAAVRRGGGRAGQPVRIPRRARVPGLARARSVPGRRRPGAGAPEAVPGTIFLPAFINDGLVERVAESGLDALATPVTSGWVDEGNDLGTDGAIGFEMPRVAVLMGDGVAATSYGAHWFFLDQTVGLPFDALPVDRLGAIDLGQYDVLVMPDMSPAALNEARVQQIDAWVRSGGTLVAVAGGARLAADRIASVERRAGAHDSERDATDRALRGREQRQLERWERNVPGAVLAARLDTAHPLAFGAGIEGDDESIFVLHASGLSFEPDESFESVAFFPEDLTKISGVIHEDVIERLQRSTWLATRNLGRGRAILFADDPLFRHFWYAGFLLYMNAVVIGPSM